jgi:hypothetical protein
VLRVIVDNHLVMARGYEINGNKAKLRDVGKVMSELLGEQ